MPYTHLSADEIAKADAGLKRKRPVTDILKDLQKARAQSGGTGPSRSALFRFAKGDTYVRETAENRGRPVTRPRDLVKVADKERKRLVKEADNQYLVTWEDVHKATTKAFRKAGKLTKGVKMVSADWMSRQVRSTTAVRARPGKRRISRDKGYEERRHEQAILWAQKPKSWWTEHIHAYIDNKKFVLARTEKEKKLLRATKIHHHLRTPAEGTMAGFVLPRKDHMLLGVPSLEITAAVAQDRIILWHVSEKPWNGEKAADMYEKLGDALRKHYGVKSFYRVVEDGDTKGFQSAKGKAAKKEQKIQSWMLPPRSPGWMPLDYSLWAEIERRVLGKQLKADEPLESYRKRLHMTAKRLPRRIILGVLGKMKENIEATVVSGGKNTKME